MTTSLRLRSLALVLLASAAGCGDDPDPIVEAIGPACNPLGTDECLMPWPSMAFAEADAASPTGFRMALPIEAMPVNIDGVPVAVDRLNRWDGFSPTGPILARFDGGVSADGLPGHEDIGASLEPDSLIVLLRVDTGARVPLFAEVDVNISDVNARTLIIRPMARLDPGARYAVGIRTGVKNGAGVPLTAPAAFATVRDGGTLTHGRAARTTAGFEAMFTAFEAAGVPRGELILAWDFVTASDDFLTSDLTVMRDAALTAIDDGAGLTFETEALPSGQALRRFRGTFSSPNFLTDGERDASVLRRDDDGTPSLSGTHPARFAAIVPACVETMPLPRPTIVFGHGLFGSAEGYLDDGFVQDLAEDYCFIIIAGDFIGLTERQLALAPLAANDMNKAYYISEKLAQSVVDFIALEYLTRLVLPTDARFQLEGVPLIDPARTYYLGGSLGGIMGNVVMAYDPNLIRGVLAVPGGVWSLLFERSAAWTLLQGAAQGSYPEPGLQQMLIAIFGMAMEPIDPITIAGRVLADPLPGVPPKQLLLWEAVGDSLVTNISTEMIAREMGLDLIGPTVRQPWGLEVGTGTMTNGFTILDDHKMPVPSEFNQPEDDNGTHSGINRKPAVLRQVEAFVLDGEIVNGCLLEGAPAACDCATGACQ
ncbi:MAG: hypothetical protein R2939_06550 [Kofleriaceae bacterium]